MYILYHNNVQGCASAVPGGPWRLVFARLGNLSIFSYKSYAGHPRFYSSRAMEFLQFPLEHTMSIERVFQHM